MALLGNPSARFPNECRLRTVITTIADRPPTTASLDRVRPSSSCCWPCAMRCHPRIALPGAALRCAKGASQPLCVCVAPRGPARQPSIVFSPSVSLLFSLLLSFLHAKPTSPLTHKTYTYHTMSTRSTRKRKNEEEELVELPEDSDAESEEE